MYLATPFLMNNRNLGIFSLPLVSAHFSSAPAVPFEDVNGVIEAMNWLNFNLHSNSSVILQHVFLTWGQLYLNDSTFIVHFQNDFASASKIAMILPIIANK